MNQKELKSWTGYIEVICAGICFGFLGIFGRYAFASGISVGELLTLRFSIAALLLWSYALTFNRNLVLIPKRQILISFLLGIFGYAVFSNLYFLAIKGVSVAIAAMLLFTFPIFVNIGSHFFLKEKLKNNEILILMIVSMGLILLLWGEMSIKKASAVFCALGAALTYSIYILVSGKFQKNVKPLSSSIYIITATAITLIIFNFHALNHVAQYTTSQVSYIIGIAILCTILPLTLFLSGMQKLTGSTASIAVMIEPVTASLASFIFLGESLNLRQIAGALIVIAALICLGRLKNSKKQAKRLFHN